MVIFCLESSPPDDTSRRSTPAWCSFSASMVVCSMPLEYAVGSTLGCHQDCDSPPSPFTILVPLRTQDFVQPVGSTDSEEERLVPDFPNSLDSFHCYSSTVLKRPAVFVGTFVGERVKELCEDGSVIFDSRIFCPQEGVKLTVEEITYCVYE